MVMNKTQWGLRIYAPQIDFICLGLQKKKRSIRKENKSKVVKQGFGCFKCPLNSYTPFSIHFADQQRANYFFCNYGTLSTLKLSGIQGRGVDAIPGRFF